MDNNDVFRRIRYIFDLSDQKIISLFALEGMEVEKATVVNWLKKEDDPFVKNLQDLHLAIFLNGFISDRRGKREGPQPPAEKRLSNNLVLRKLKIALDLKTDDIIAIFKLVDVAISQHELSAFFRNPKQKQFRHCNDQYLRNFLSALVVKYREDGQVTPKKKGVKNKLLK